MPLVLISVNMSRIYYYYFILVVLLACWMVQGSSNITEENDEDDYDDDLDMDFETFKRTIKRYRRLIPYMSNYVANNQMTTPSSSSQIYEGNEPLTPQRLILQPEALRQRPFRHRITTMVKSEKFVPSVQYDPKEIGGDNDYFTPVRYTKPTYDDYYRDYDRRPVYPKITTPKIEANGYYSKEQVSRPQSSLTYSQLPKISNAYNDYLIDYVPRGKPTVQTQEYYPVEDFDSIRYVKIEPPRVYQHEKTRNPSVNPLIRRPIYQSKIPVINDENIIKSFHLTNQLPEMLNRDNIDSSIKTLVEILNLLHGTKKPDNTSPSHLSEPVVSQNIQSYENLKQQYTTRPRVVTETRYQATPSPSLVENEQVGFKSSSYTNNGKSKLTGYSDYGIKNHDFVQYYQPVIQEIDENSNIHDYEGKPYKIDGNPLDYETRPYAIKKKKPYKLQTSGNYEINENIDENDSDGGRDTTTEIPKHFQLAEGLLSDALNIPTMAIKYGATRGKPNIDYPAYTAIPETDFNCKEQRYKGFFGDPSTGCQVWHYCDLNGGKSSFLCPNGTIFSQAALTCDWWFNVKCESTTQLYVLNERLYKFILPIMPKFPEDFSGPEVDRYLEMKFKEMEAKMKAKKLKKAMEKKKQTKVTMSSTLE